MGPARRRAIRVVVHPELTRADIWVLADRLVRRLRDGNVATVLVDASRVQTPDLVYVEALTRLQLSARRNGSRVRLIGPCPRLLELLAVLGLDDMLAADGEGSGELHRQAEHREQPIDVKVGVDPGDPVA